MSALPPRRVLRSIVSDAIGDREGFDDPSIADETAASIASYQSLLTRLGDHAPPLTAADRETLAWACQHARIWREGYKDAWKCTGEKAVLLEAQQDIDRVTRTQTALGIVQVDPFTNMTAVSIFDLMKRTRDQRTFGEA